MAVARTPRQQDRRIDGRRAPRRSSVRMSVRMVRAALLSVAAIVALAVGSAPADAASASAVARPTDPGFAQQWGLENRGQSVLGDRGTPGADVSALAAWRVTRGAGVTVGVVDSGIDADTGVRVAPGGFDSVDADATPIDRNGHGTAISSILAAPVDDAGVVGLAPEASVVGFRVLDANGNGTLDALADGLDRAGDLGLRIVNASVSGDDSPALEAAIAAHPDTLYVVAAGNDGTDESARPTYPCASPAANVICVGASDQDDRVLPVSNTGAEAVDLFAPGAKILTDILGDREAYDDGTSMATAFVSGAAALLLSVDPTLSTADLKAALMNSTDHRDALSAASVSGGRLNAAAALAAIGATAPAAAPAPTAVAVSRAKTRSVKMTKAAAKKQVRARG
jgi:subtilisin family serine protease